MRCTGEPVSWLRLELYGLGELPEPEARAVAQHLAECGACQACYERVVAAAPPPAATILERPKRPAWRSRPLWAAGSVIGVALAAWLIVSPRAVEPPGREGVKGAGVALELVRVDEHGAPLEPTHFAASDRFKALVSCALPGESEASVLVFQAGQAFEAVPPTALGACGNRRDLPGAFRVSGESAADVCVVLTKPGRATGAAKAPDELTAPHACTRISPGEH